MNSKSGAMPRYINELNEVGGLSGTDIANIADVSKATVSRWKAGTVKPQPSTQLMLSDLYFVVGRLREYYSADEIRTWLYARHPQLAGERAIDLINQNRSEDVLRVIDRLDAEVFLYTMAMSRPPRDNRLLDAIDAFPGASFSGTGWRVTREGRDPIQCSAVGGRWDDRTFDVLYTSTKADGAIAEMYFHVSRGQPVMPSQVRYHLHELTVSLASCLKLVLLDALQALGLRTTSFGQLSYFEREQEYPRTQEIAEVAYFLGRDGIIVPSARSEHDNLIVFCDPAGPAAVEVVRDHGPVVWEDWRKTPLGY